MATLAPSRKIAYHITDGPMEMYTIDANSAVGRHPKEWSFKPHGEAGERFDARGVVEIPAGWRDLSSQQRRSFAIRLGEPSTITATQADDVLAKEEDRREKLPPEPEHPRNQRTQLGVSPTQPSPSQVTSQAERVRLEQAEKDRLAAEKVNEDKRKQPAEQYRQAKDK